VVESNDQQLQADFDKRFLKVLKQQVVVGHAEGSDRVVVADGVEQRCEERERVAILGAGEVLNPFVGEIVVRVGRPVHCLAQARQQQLQQFTSPRFHLSVLAQRVRETDAGFPDVFAAVDV
jgi:hypothetical protein